MADSSSYKRYGIRSENPMMGLVAGQNAVNNSFNSALDKVGELLAEELTGAKNTNTANMQSYLQQKLGDQGLAADPVDMVNIKKKFGNLIDMDQLANTEKTKRGEMTKDAVDLAGTFGLSKFNETGNLADAGTAFREQLLKAGMGALDADEKTAAWRNANKYRDLDAKTALADKTNVMLSELGKVWAGGGDDSSIDKYVNDNFDEKDRPDAKRAAKKYYGDLSKFDEKDKSDITDLQTRLATASEIAQTQYDDAYNKIQGQLGALDSMSPESQAIGDKAFNVLGGDAAFNENGEFKESLPAAAVNSFFQLFNGNVTGKAAKKFIQDDISSMVASGIPRKTAVAISINAYNAAKPSSSSTNIGNGIDMDVYNKMSTPMKKNAIDRKKYSSQLADAGSRRSLGMASLKKQNDALLRKFKQELRKENLGQGKFDQSSYFSDKAAGNSGGAGGSGGSGETGSSFTNTVNAGKGKNTGETPTDATDKSGGKLTAEEELNNIKTYAKDREQIADRARAYTRESPQRLTPEPSSGDMTNPLDVQEVMRRNILRSTESVRAPQEKAMVDAVKTAGNMVADYSPFGLGWKGIKNLSKSAQNAFTDFHNWAQDFADRRYKTPEAKKKASSEEVLQAYLKENPDFAKRMDDALVELNAKDKSSKK